MKTRARFTSLSGERRRGKQTSLVVEAEMEAEDNMVE